MCMCACACVCVCARTWDAGTETGRQRRAHSLPFRGSHSLRLRRSRVLWSCALGAAALASARDPLAARSGAPASPPAGDCVRLRDGGPASLSPAQASRAQPTTTRRRCRRGPRPLALACGRPDQLRCLFQPPGGSQEVLGGHSACTSPLLLYGGLLPGTELGTCRGPHRRRLTCSDVFLQDSGVPGGVGAGVGAGRRPALPSGWVLLSWKPTDFLPEGLPCRRGRPRSRLAAPRPHPRPRRADWHHTAWHPRGPGVLSCGLDPHRLPRGNAWHVFNYSLVFSLHLSAP